MQKTELSFTSTINPLMSGGNTKVHSYLNMLKAAGLSMCDLFVTIRH